MDDNKIKKDQLAAGNNDTCDHLIGKLLPKISLSNQDGNLLKLNRSDTFRLVVYFFSLTGHPQKKLPHKWDQIPGAQGCTLENCLFRDNYEKFIELNCLPIGISTQPFNDIKEMTLRLGLQYDVLSDLELESVNQLKLPTFSVKDKVYIKRLTIIVEKNLIKKVFFPIFSIDKHVSEVLKWLKEN